MTRRDDIAALITEIQDWFIEEPALALTLSEVQQRSGADRVTCQAVLGYLAEAKVLAHTSARRYVRLFPRLASRPVAGGLRRGQPPRGIAAASMAHDRHAAA